MGEEFELVSNYEEESGFKDVFVYRAKNPHEVVIIPSDYKVLSVSFKNHNIMVERLSITTLEELEKLFPDEN